MVTHLGPYPHRPVLSSRSPFFFHLEGYTEGAALSWELRRRCARHRTWASVDRHVVVTRTCPRAAPQLGLNAQTRSRSLWNKIVVHPFYVRAFSCSPSQERSQERGHSSQNYVA